MKLRPRDVISYQGRDFIIEGVLTYRLAGKSYPIARAVDGDTVLWIEPPLEPADDRLLFLREVFDLSVGTPPPSTIDYKGSSYVPRLSGAATVDVDGSVIGRTAGTAEIWRYRAPGDLYLQIEKWPTLTVALAGESVHQDMIELFPAP